MANDQTQEHKDFFISYTAKDSQWAQWIAFELEAIGCHTFIQAWDIRPGSNFVAEMDDAAKHAERTLLVLSEAYLGSDYAFAEWAAAFRRDPRGKQGKVLPVRIQPCRIEGLLRRAGLLPVEATLEQAFEHDRSVACAICEEVGGLPLALDQAGAYIEETGCSLAEYQRLYQHRRADLLAERRGQLVDDHPLPVATTWSLSFAQVEQKNPAAADLLRVCAFLAPDAIPEELITEGAEHLGPNLAPVGADTYLLNQSIEALRAYSLLRREASSGTAPSLSVHRLVQAVLQDELQQAEKQLWVKRVVLAVNQIFPPIEYANWPQCERLLPQALVCVPWVAHEFIPALEASCLLRNAGNYLQERGQYSRAEPLLEQALVISEQQLTHTPRHLAI